MHHYLKHAFLIAVVPLVAGLLVLAPRWAFMAPLFLMAFHVALDMGTSRDTTVPSYRFPRVVDAYLYLHIAVTVFCLAMLLGFAAGPASWLELLGASFTVGFLISGSTLVGHELTHRVTDRFAMLAGRVSLALVGDAQFSISHVYGHHVNVATAKDAATARRGENLYAFAVRSTLGQYREAWQIERRRLRGRSRRARALANRVISGLGMTAVVLAVFWLFAGWRGLAAYALVWASTKFMFEAVNYIEHYGLVRVPGSPVEARHSWDCSTRAACNILLNLPRHAHHHADPSVKYWALRPTEGSPDLPYGYIAHIALAMIPPLWHRFSAPRLAEWDATMATPGERELAALANRLSGHRLLVRAAIPGERPSPIN